MARKHKGIRGWRVEYDNGDYRYYNHEYHAIRHARHVAKTMLSVKITVDGLLVAMWQNGCVVYYAPDIPYSLV